MPLTLKHAVFQRNFCVMPFPVDVFSLMQQKGLHHCNSPKRSGFFCFSMIFRFWFWVIRVIRFRAGRVRGVGLAGPLRRFGKEFAGSGVIKHCWLVVWKCLEPGFFFHILGIISKTDFHIFQRGQATTNQLCIVTVVTAARTNPGKVPTHRERFTALGCVTWRRGKVFSRTRGLGDRAKVEDSDSARSIMWGWVVKTTVPIFWGISIYYWCFGTWLDCLWLFSISYMG